MYKEVNPKTIKSGTINIREDVGDIGPLVRKIIARLEVGKSGIAVPLIVTPIDDPDFDYEVIDGERRLHSALEVGLPLVPIVIENAGTSKEPLSWDSYDANDARLSNNWFEVGKFFARENDNEMSYSQIGERATMSKSQVHWYINGYRKLSPFARANEIGSIKTVRNILEKGDTSDYERIIERVLVDQLSYRDTEKLLVMVEKIRTLLVEWVDQKAAKRVSDIVEPMIYEKVDLTLDTVKNALLKESGILLEDIPAIRLTVQLIKKMKEFNSKCPQVSEYKTWEDKDTYYYSTTIKIKKEDFRKAGTFIEDS